MDVAHACARCGTPATGTRFCTSCGAPVSGAVGDTAAEPTALLRGTWAPGDGGMQAAVVPNATTVLAAPPVPVDEQTPPWLSDQPVPQPPRTRPSVLALLVLAALALSAWAIVRGVEEHTLSGTVLVLDSRYSSLGPGATCSGEGGYGDLGGGAQVVLTDDGGETISTGRLSGGEFDGLGCVFSFALEDVTRSDFYGLTVADGSRGQLQYSYEELSDDNWSVQLSIGDE